MFHNTQLINAGKHHSHIDDAEKCACHLLRPVARICKNIYGHKSDQNGDQHCHIICRSAGNYYHVIEKAAEISDARKRGKAGIFYPERTVQLILADNRNSQQDCRQQRSACNKYHQSDRHKDDSAD